MNGLLEQTKKQRKQLGLKQADMMLRAGISRQQYQHMESKGNPRLDTLELDARGLNSELLLVPKDKLLGVKADFARTNWSYSVSVLWRGSGRCPAVCKALVGE